MIGGNTDVFSFSNILLERRDGKEEERHGCGKGVWICGYIILQP